MSDNRSNGSHSPFRPTRLTPSNRVPYFDAADPFDNDPALEHEQEADAEAEAYIARNFGDCGVPLSEDRREAGNSVLIFGSAIWILAVVAVQFI